jgi:hypothetical protein
MADDSKPTAKPVDKAEPLPGTEGTGVDPIALGFEAPMAAITSGLSAVLPFYKYLASKAVGAITGQDPAAVQAQIAAQQAAHPTASAIGTGAGIATAITANPFGGASAATRVLGSGALAGVFAAGNVAAEQQTAKTPLDHEKLLTQVGIPTLLGLGLGAAVEVPGGAGKLANMAALKTARRALKLDTITEEAGSIAQRALDEGLLTSDGAKAAEAARQSIGGKIGAEFADPAARNDAGLIDQLREIGTPRPGVPASRASAKAVKDIADAMEKSGGSLPDMQGNIQSLADRMETAMANKDHISADIYSKALETLRDASVKARPNLSKLNPEYGFYADVAPRAFSAADAPMGNPFVIMKGAVPGFTKAQQATGLDWLGKKADAWQAGLDSEIGQMFREGPQAVLKANGVNVKDYSKIKDVVDAIIRDPATFNNNLTAATAHMDPQTAQGVTARTQMAVDYLHNSMPKNPHTPLPGDLDWEPNDSQKAQIINVYRTLVDPKECLRNPDPACIAAVKAVFPEHLAEFQKAVSNRVAEDKNMPYSVKQRVSEALGMPMEASQLPEFGARMQTRMKAYRERKASVGQSGSARTAGAMKKQDKAAVTQAQRIQNQNEEF